MSENSNTAYCPGCGRHCPLSAPACERGAMFAQRGASPSAEGRPQEDRRALYEGLDTDGKLLWNLRGLGRSLHDLHEGRASQERILGLLNEEPVATQRALTERLGVQPGTASEVIGKLESAGLIARQPSEEDRRTWEIRLTEEGRVAARAAEGQRRQRREGLFACLSAEERATLLNLTERLLADWRERFGRPLPPRREGRGRRHGIPYEEGAVRGLPRHPEHGEGRGRRPHHEDGGARPMPHHPGDEGHARTMPHHPDDEGGARTLPHRPDRENGVSDPHLRNL